MGEAEEEVQEVAAGKQTLWELRTSQTVDYEKEDKIVPFGVNKDPSIALNDEDTPVSY
jgi:hypothetical protein